MLNRKKNLNICVDTFNFVIIIIKQIFPYKIIFQVWKYFPLKISKDIFYLMSLKN